MIVATRAHASGAYHAFVVALAEDEEELLPLVMPIMMVFGSVMTLLLILLVFALTLVMLLPALINARHRRPDPIAD